MPAFFVILTVLILDQLSKIAVLHFLQPGDSRPLIEGVFHLSLVFNRGAAFGLFAQQGWALLWLILISAAIIVFIFRFLKKGLAGSLASQVYLALILGGAVGNLIDRLRFGYVVDFLDFRIWPVFNLADSAITVGTALLILHLLKYKK